MTDSNSPNTHDAESGDTSTARPKRVPVEIVGSDLPPADPTPPTVVSIEPAESSPEHSTNEVSEIEASDSAQRVADKETDEAPVSEGDVATESEPGEEAIPGQQDTMGAFSEMGLAPFVLKSIETAGYTSPTPIQDQTVPIIMEGRDLIGQAETGSGKTAAFAWPVLSRIEFSSKLPQVLVLAPTRELAVQVTNAFRTYASGMDGFRSTTLYGGQSYETQFRALDRGVHVVVGTPGRLLDHLNRGTLDLSELKVLILDEADEMLRMGFIDDIEAILEKTPRTQQSLFFSATMPPPIKRIAQTYLSNPEHIRIEGSSATADSIEQSCLFVEPREKLQRLVRFLETEETDGVLVFTKTRHSTNVVAEHLIQQGMIASSLNGDIPQAQRERTVAQLKSGKIKIVVATDVAARGLDVSRISHVINYDFPHDTEAYIHRIGRTGRAGRQGNAVLFVEPREKGKLGRLQRETNQRIEPFKQKSLKEINQIRVNRFKQRIVDAADNKQFEFFHGLVQELMSESEMELDQIAASLAVMAQGDNPLLLEALKSPQSNWKKDRQARAKRDQTPMQSFRVEVGRSDGVGPGNLVGAITNEANLTNADIGRIRIFDRFSVIDLPVDFPEDLVQHLSGVLVGGRPLQMTRTDQVFEDRGRPGARGKRGFGSRGGRPSGGPGGRRSSGPGGRGGRGFQSGHRGGSSRPTGRGGDRSFDRGDDRSYDRKRERSSDRGPGRSSARSTDTSQTSESGGRRGGKKTKAALRAKAKRKPDAKISSPVRKYVKVRAVRKKGRK